MVRMSHVTYCLSSICNRKRERRERAAKASGNTGVRSRTDKQKNATSAVANAKMKILRLCMTFLSQIHHHLYVLLEAGELIAEFLVVTNGQVYATTMHRRV